MELFMVLFVYKALILIPYTSKVTLAQNLQELLIRLTVLLGLVRVFSRLFLHDVQVLHGMLSKVTRK